MSYPETLWHCSIVVLPLYHGHRDGLYSPKRQYYTYQFHLLCIVVFWHLHVIVKHSYELFGQINVCLMWKLNVLGTEEIRLFSRSSYFLHSQPCRQIWDNQLKSNQPESLEGTQCAHIQPADPSALCPHACKATRGNPITPTSTPPPPYTHTYAQRWSADAIMREHCCCKQFTAALITARCTVSTLGVNTWEHCCSGELTVCQHAHPQTGTRGRATQEQHS